MRSQRGADQRLYYDRWHGLTDLKFTCYLVCQARTNSPYHPLVWQSSEAPTEYQGLYIKCPHRLKKKKSATVSLISQKTNNSLDLTLKSCDIIKGFVDQSLSSHRSCSTVIYHIQYHIHQQQQCWASASSSKICLMWWCSTGNIVNIAWASKQILIWGGPFLDGWSLFCCCLHAQHCSASYIYMYCDQLLYSTVKHPNHHLNYKIIQFLLVLDESYNKTRP